MYKYLFVAFVCLCSFSGKPGKPKAANPVLIYHVNVIDVTTGKIAVDKAILVIGNRIEGIGDYATLQSKNEKARQVDAGGRYAIPGLWDMHVHIEGSDPDLRNDNLALFPVFIAYGVTTIRDCASDLGLEVLAWRDQVNQGKLFGPRIFTAGIKLEGIKSKWKGDFEIANEQELKVKLDTLVKLKVDFVKVTDNTLPGELFLKSVIAAKKLGFKVSGHVPMDLSIHDLADAGYTSIEHGSYLLRLGYDEQKIAADLRSGAISRSDAGNMYRAKFDQQKAIDGYKYLAEKKVAVCPTLTGGYQGAYPDKDDHRKDEYLQYLTKRFQASYDWKEEGQAPETESQLKQRRDNFEFLSKQLPIMQSAGMVIIAGTDAAAMNSFIYPGMALHRELEIYQQAGMSPLSVLQSATINGAGYFGVRDSLATLEPGKIADIVLLDENPLQDITATKKIFAVVKNGVYFDRTALDGLLESARKRKMELDTQR